MVWKIKSLNDRNFFHFENFELFSKKHCHRTWLLCAPTKENRIYIRVEFRKSLGMNFVSPFQPEREFKVYKSCKCSYNYYKKYLSHCFYFFSVFNTWLQGRMEGGALEQIQGLPTKDETVNMSWNSFNMMIPRLSFVCFMACLSIWIRKK